MRELVVATTNAGKLAELRGLLAGLPVRVRSLGEFEGVGVAAETGETFAENARQKALYYGERLGGWVLADDSGLEVDALGGEPGVHSACFAGVEGPGRDEANNRKLLELLSDKPLKERTARFRCSLCLADGEEALLAVDGEVEGVIIDEARGDNGFGYDPIFLIEEKEMTAAELAPAEKNVISHRGRALAKLVVELRERFL